MTVDSRTRVDGARPAQSADELIAHLREHLEANAEVLASGVEWLDLRPLIVEVDGRIWTLVPNGGVVSIVEGTVEGGAHWRLTSEQLADVLDDQSSVVALFSSGQIVQVRGRIGHLMDWWLVVRSAMDAVPVYTPGSLDLTAGEGQPLDLTRGFRLDDDPAEMAAFLQTAGFLHLVGVYSPDEMAEVAAEMDRAAPSYSPGDGRSWWATLDDGTERLVRMQGFDQHAPIVAGFLDDERIQAMALLTGDGHQIAGRGSSNRIEALYKPIGVTQGISDVPWHKDCSLGRHSYECCSLTMGISVTAGRAGSGQLRVVAGSHRALVWGALGQPGLDLPEVQLPTGVGDVTLHLSCTLHMAEPPTIDERRVMYTSFRLPSIDTPEVVEAAAEARRRLIAIRESAPVTVSQ